MKRKGIQRRSGGGPVDEPANRGAEFRGKPMAELGRLSSTAMQKAMEKHKPAPLDPQERAKGGKVTRLVKKGKK